MYDNPQNLRENRIQLRLNDRELQLLKAMAEYKGIQLAAFARKLVMQQADSFASQYQNDSTSVHR